MVNKYTCIACGGTGGTDPSVSCFRLPQQETIRRKWLENCNIDPNLNLPSGSRICMKHFSADDIIGNDKRRVLKKNAAPFIHDISASDRNKRRWCNRTMRFCFVCERYGDLKSRSYHKFPADLKLRGEWLEILAKKLPDFSTYPTGDLFLCDIHFRESDVWEHPVTKRRRLRRGTVPLPCTNTQPSTTSSTATHRMEVEEIEDSDPSDASDDDVRSVPSSSPLPCSITIDVDEEEASELEKSDTNCDESPQEQNSETVNVESDTESIPCEATSNHSDISSSEDNVVPESFIDLTIPETVTSSFQGVRTRCADGLRIARVFNAEDLNPPKYRLKQLDLNEAFRREKIEIRRLRRSNRIIKKQLEDFRKVIDDLLRRNLVTAEGRRMIEEFKRRNNEFFENENHQ